MGRETRVRRLPMSGPDDVSAILAAVGRGEIAPSAIRAILGKTEGNGCVNDFTRGYAVASLKAALAPLLPPGRLETISMVMSGGTEGGLSPHWLVFEEIESEAPAGPPALAIGVARTRALAPGEIGRAAQADAVREAALAAMAEAGIEDPADVHYVQVKCPLLTAERAARAGGPAAVATTSTIRSMGLSRGASALGVALALGEVAPGAVTDAAICGDWGLWSGRASCSAGVELEDCEVAALGLSPAWSGPLRIAHAVMADAIDAPAAAGLLSAFDPGFRAQLTAEGGARFVALLAKAEASASGAIRGARHTMLDDSDIASTRHARGFVGGMLAGLTGTTELFVSGGAEHQGPDGGGPCAVIWRDD
ncbi:ring-opening amidohydrolase [uncultured Albimonas sp.]|uniref:cyanuric acid amidohydrolase n=1 Tax=uncultured Albimonas sp. TaxID=1331701 RepID=UPI0030EDDC22|tara:strand:- start:1661 stop:2755 length:1095 start_codon:yes stop_codon:yes gene_type:complete